MLQIATDTLPQSLLSYVAFRVALRQTAEALSHQGSALWESTAQSGHDFLAEVPFLKEVPPQIQLDLLAETWDRHISRETFTASLVDEAVVYAVCEFTAQLAEHDPERITWCLRGGPLDVTVPVDHHLSAELRALYLNLSNEGDFLLISQFLDLPPDEASDWKSRLGLDEARIGTLFDVVGRWHPTPELLGNLQGLVSVGEAPRLARLLRVPIPA